MIMASVFIAMAYSEVIKAGYKKCNKIPLT